MATRDGGLNWASGKIRSTVEIGALAFTDSSHGWAVGNDDLSQGGIDPDGEIGVIASTTNGGRTWRARDVSGVETDLYGVAFIDRRRGWAVGSYGTLLCTNDGGKSWLRQRSGTTNDLLGIAFVDDEYGIVVGARGTILATSDGGISWRRLHSGVRYDLCGVAVASNSRVWIVGDANTVLSGRLAR